MSVWIAMMTSGPVIRLLRCLSGCLDEIKVDKSFVMGLTTEAQDVAIVRATINLGQSLGLTVTAEGVENQETADYLAELDCDFTQAYYYSRRVLAADITPWLQSGQQTFVPLQQTRSVQRFVEHGKLSCQ